jgi:hypothetical protein
LHINAVVAFYSIFDVNIIIMKKGLLFVLLLISIAVHAQNAGGAKPKVTMDINKQLYPEADADGRHSISPEAALQATYLATPYDASKLLFASMGQQMGLQDIKITDIIVNNKPISIITGFMDNGPGGKMVMELYLIGVTTVFDDEGSVIVMSGYPEAHKKTFAAEGKKAALSVVVTQ